MVMKKFNIILFIFLILFNLSCSKEISKNSTLTEKSIELQVAETYKEAKRELETGDVLYAAKKFNEIEILFPQSEWASKSTLMAAYAYYSQDYIFDAIEELKIFIRKYPNHENIAYAEYLMAMCYYEKIVDEKKDLSSLINSKKYFESVINNYPNTDYALDSKFKLNLINDVLASKEIYLGRYYLDKKKWIAAINRFRAVIDNYETTIYTEEALYRLVEVYYILGLEKEAKKYAVLLGYNYQSSEWYEKSYKVFNNTYEKQSQKIAKDDNVLKKIKSIFD
jgi:outer membrane protein assembly factor BamD